MQTVSIRRRRNTKTTVVNQQKQNGQNIKLIHGLSQLPNCIYIAGRSF